MQNHFFLVIDFEATCCDQKRIPRNQMEIIEFGAVIVNSVDYSIVSEFQRFIRPIRHPILTTFCTKLTSISQKDIESAPQFIEVIEDFKSWLYSFDDFIFCSWGDYDLNQLQQDCAFHKIAYPINANHLNVKRLFSEKQNLSKKLGLNQAIHLAGLSFSGTHHRGIDDARNIARLLPFIFGSEKIK